MHTRFRGCAARANYLAADRPDAFYSAKEVCRFMSRPTNLALIALERLCRYLRAWPRLVYTFARQSAGCIDRRILRHRLGRVPSDSQVDVRGLPHDRLTHYQVLERDAGQHRPQLWRS